MPRRAPISTFSACLLMLAAGCQTFHIEPVMERYRVGDLEGAYEELSDPPWYRKKKDHDLLAWELEEGKLLHDLGRYEESAAVLERALERFRVFEEETAKVSVTNELDGILRGQVRRDYRGSYADAIHAASLLALDYLALGRFSDARAASREAADWQEAAELRNQAELDRSQELARGQGLDARSILQSPEVRSASERLDSRINPAYAKFLNPFAAFVSALTHLAVGNEREAIEDFSLVEGMVPDNRFVTDLRQTEGSEARDRSRRTVVVLFEKGLAPRREQIILPILTERYGVTPITIPALQFESTGIGTLAVHGSGGLIARTRSLASIDSIRARQFRDDLPGLLIRTLIGTIAREGIVRVAENNQALGDLTRIFTTLYKISAAGADLRTWRTLGNEIQLAVFPAPPDGKIELQIEDTRGAMRSYLDVPLPGSDLDLILVRGLGPEILIVHPPIPVPRPGARSTGPPAIVRQTKEVYTP